MGKLKKSLIVFLFGLPCIFANSQYKVEGYIISTTKDTTWGTINIRKKKKSLNLQALHRSVTFSSKSISIEMDYTPADILGFGLRSDYLNDDYISPKSLGEKSKNYFYRRIVSGYIEIFDLDLKELKSTMTAPSTAPNGIPRSNIFYKIE